MNILPPLPTVEFKLPTVPDGFEVVIHRHRHPDTPADGVAWHVQKTPKSAWARFFSFLSDTSAATHVTRVRGGIDLFEQDMQEQADEYFAERNSRELAQKIRNSR